MSKKRIVVIAVLLGLEVLGGVGAVGFGQYHEHLQFPTTCNIAQLCLES
jgi:hypothetical protein